MNTYDQIDGWWEVETGDPMLADPEEDLRGREVLDNLDHRLGFVDALVVDGREHGVRLLRLAAEQAEDWQAAKFLIPMEAVYRITASSVSINRMGDHVRQGPPHQPSPIARRILEAVYAHYGCYPAWVPAHVYPTYPVY